MMVEMKEKYLTQKVVYIAGPYRAPTEWGVYQNIRKAEEAAIELWHMGAAVICPHKNTAFFGGAAHDDVWLEGDRAILRRCDAVYCIEGWENSTGAKCEIELATQLGIPIFYTKEEFQEWLSSQE
jgi:Domain of unknown function (DUF4406)